MFGLSKATNALIIAAVSSLLLMATPLQALALGHDQASKGITLTPTYKEITLGPGLLSASTDIIVTNKTNYIYNAKIKLVDFKALSSSGGVSLEQAGSKYGLANWMSLPGGNALSLSPGQTADIKIIISNRSDLSPGGHYGAAVLDSTQNADQSNSIGLSQQLVSLIFLKKEGGDHPGLKLTSIQGPSGGYDLPDTITTVFKSTGNVFVVPRGYITLTDPTDKLIYKGILNPESTIVMQDSSRVFITPFNMVQPPKVHGRYKLTVYYRYDGSNHFDTAVRYFNYQDKYSLYGLIAAAIIIVLVIYFALHRLRKTKRRK